ncbi:phosphomannomutase/phosphoglucomutase, partial [Patescibacteria group bacterium]
MDIPASIFKAYDIRGLAPGEITEEVAWRVGQALVVETGARAILVGRDMRETSPKLEQAVVAGIKSQGADAVRIGLTTTPMFYFAVAAYELHDAGAMVTASHNPSQYNGFKLVRDDSTPIGGGSGMEEVRDRALSGRLLEKPSGQEVQTDVVDAYVAKVKEIAPPKSVGNLKIAIDSGNGMAGHTLPKLLRAYPQLQTERLYFELDGTFPNHEANPIKLET